MSQRVQNLNEEIIVELKLRVNINSMSNHNGFSNGQITKAIDEFKDEIKKELQQNVCGTFQQQEFLQSVDFVSYTVDAVNGI